jgi:hydrogenase maturation protein HypF
MDRSPDSDVMMIQRLNIAIRGAVQGVGFRPFVYRLATEMKLTGWVLNSVQGVFIEVEGRKLILDNFLLRIEKEKPPRSFIQSLEFSFFDPVGFKTFEIRESKNEGEITAIVLPDIATCPDCLEEIFDSADRRYLYPFTNCTNCGPRFSIIESLPYDRPNTTMKNFMMCADCRREYDDPLNRRFHAQPNACSKCGPRLELWNSDGGIITTDLEALIHAVDEIRGGRIVAVKGLGGFHLIVDAQNEDAVLRIREHKHREEKPFALMYPSVEMIKQDCEVSILEERLLKSSESPIVLLKRKTRKVNLKPEICISVAPNNPYLGVMLPYTPLHHILMREIGFPVVATSGNFSDEPICIDERVAQERLRGIADIFLVHNRPIQRHVDDSIVRIIMEREMVLRRARGYAPLPIHLQTNNHGSILAVGAHLKNTTALFKNDNVFVSQHIGDLETKEAFEAFQNVIESFKSLYHISPTEIVSDLHPAYLSTQYAKGKSTSLIQIQHHYAHTASCMAENKIDGQVLGVSWDGTGFGDDGTLWGGEFLLTDETSFERVASFRQFKLPGGERAIKEPRRTALGVLHELFGENFTDYNDLQLLQACSATELRSFQRMLSKNINSPVTSSVGRLFDAVASLIGLRQFVSFEGQAAMDLEFVAASTQTNEHYPWSIINSGLINIGISNNPQSTVRNPKFIIDWSPMFHQLIADVEQKRNIPDIVARFHNTLVGIIIDIAKRVGEKRVVLSGGCFQNKYLIEHSIQKLEAAGFHPYWHQRVPPNDGGISLGQIAAVLRMSRKEKTT